jgi:hypothetical protein
MGKHLPDVEFIRSIMDYDRDTGHLTWKRRDSLHPSWNTKYAGKRVGCRRGDGYIVLGLGGAVYFGHRVAWAIVTGEWPKNEIDHRDLNPSNNAWDNLRAATSADNKRNRGHVPNRSGVKGVGYYAATKRWRARIKVGDKEVWSGYFTSVDEAAAARAAALPLYHGEFARAA